MKKAHTLVDISIISPSIVLDIKYATVDNFIGKPMYSQAKAYLQAAVAAKLDRVQTQLGSLRLGLKIWDAYRPYSVQKLLWAEVPDERYVADPQKGSSHNRGAAIDVTLVDHLGQELVMPTKFDDFTCKAHRSCMDHSPEALRNRDLLEKIMVDNGFVPLETEWWHFNDASSLNYPLLDISFEEL